MDTKLNISTAYLKPIFAFELGTEKSSDTEEHLNNDLEKLSKINPDGYGYIIHIYKDVTQSHSRSGRRINKEEKKLLKENACF